MTIDDLGFDLQQVASWFPHKQEAPYVLVRVSDEHAKALTDVLGVPVRRCYVSDITLIDRAKATGVSEAELIAAKLTDPGATMAGDFGEILVYLYQATREHPTNVIGPKKWRLKQDRTKPAPHSDVVQFVLPSWPLPTADDLVLCAEVKTKSTNGASTPIKSAIDDCAKDRTSRLTRTLVWLRERALFEPLDDIQLAHLNRFINATEYPPAKKHFSAVAVICSSLVEAELVDAPKETPSDYTVVVIAVPELYKIYNAAFETARKQAPSEEVTMASVPGESSA